LSIANLQHFFARCQKEYQEAHKLPDAEEARQRVKTIYERIRTKIISEVTVRRTRNDLMEHDDYKKDLEQQAVVFPRSNRRAKFSTNFRLRSKTFTTARCCCSRVPTTKG